MPLRAKAYKACRVCGESYRAWSAASQLNRFCGPVCAAKHGQAKRDEARAKAFNASIRERKAALRTRGDYIKAAQSAFNAFIRCRDEGKPCISCGSFPEQRYGGTMDCGHYRSTGAAPHLRFNTFNAAGQCVKCNQHLSGNTVEMRKGMALRFGRKKLYQIEADDMTRRYTKDDLQRIKRIFSRRARNYRKWRTK